MSWVAPSFSVMRGDAGRSWLRRSDILAALAAESLPMSWYEAKQILATMPKPAKVHGHFQFTVEHRDAVLAAARMQYSARPGAEPLAAVGERSGGSRGNRRSGDGSTSYETETPPDAPRHGANTRRVKV